MSRFGRSFPLPRRITFRRKIPILQNTFEGGTNGTGITAGNSGGLSGDAFNVLTLAGTPVSTATYINTPDRPAPSESTLVARLNTVGSTSGAAYFQWTTALTNFPPSGAKNEFWARAYIYVATAATLRFFGLRNGTTQVGGWGYINNTTRNIVIRDSAGAASAVMGTGTPVNAWYRVEWYYNRTTGNVEIRLYLRPNDTTYDESLTATGLSLGASGWDRFDFGPHTAGADIYVDDYAVSTSGWIGPNPYPSETPIADAGADQLGVTWASTVNLSGSNSIGTGLTYKWEQVYGPTVTLNNPTTATPNFVADDE